MTNSKSADGQGMAGRARIWHCCAVSPASSRVAVIVNPTKAGADEVRRRTVERASLHGWTDPVIYETTEDDPGLGQAAEAAAGGVGLVIACGGDGTV